MSEATMTQVPEWTNDARPRPRRHDSAGAHRRDHQRLRRGRAALRPVARLHRRPHGQRHLDDRDHPRRDPSAGAQRRRCQRQPHPHRLRHASPTAATRPTSSSRSTSRCCSAGCATASSSRARPSCSRACGASTQTRGVRDSYIAGPRRPRRRRLPGATRSRWSRSAGSSSTTHGAARTCSRSGCSAASTASTCRPARDQIALTFGKKSQAVIDTNVMLLEAGLRVGAGEPRLALTASPRCPATEPQIVTNGNTAVALGVMASGMELCAMYPITPATSASHYLSDVFEKVGGIVHQAEDEIAACAFAIGASYAGKCTVTITSGPGYSLKQEAIGLAVMAEIPLVVVNVQRGGPSTGQPTKAEQGDLMTAIFGSHGDAPKVVMAPATIEDCFYSMITARRIAETFNMVVVVLTDAAPGHVAAALSAARSSRGVARAAHRPEPGARWAPSPTTGTTPPASPSASSPASPAACTPSPAWPTIRDSHVAYDPDINRTACAPAASSLRRCSALCSRRRLSAPTPATCWLSAGAARRAAIEEAVESLRAEGHAGVVDAPALPQPAAAGHQGDHAALRQGHRRSRRTAATTPTTRSSTSPIAATPRWRPCCASRYLVDVDCWSEVRGAADQAEHRCVRCCSRSWGS